MKNFPLLLLPLILATLACSLTDPITTTATPTAAAVKVKSVTAQPLATPRPAALPPTRAALPSPTAQNSARVTGEHVHLRACAGIGCAPVSILAAGQTVTVLATQAAPDGGHWSNVVTPSGQTGWVNSNFVEAQK